MKVKKLVVLATVVVLTLFCSSVAFAVSSPVGSTVITQPAAGIPLAPPATEAIPLSGPVKIAATSSNVSKVELASLSDATIQALENAAQAQIAEKYGANFSGTTLLSIDLVITRTDDKPVTIDLNVSGVAMGDTILIIHQKADGTIEIIEATVVEDGLIRFTLDSFSPISIVRVEPVNEVGATTKNTLPKTGDTSTAIPMALLLIASLTVLFVGKKMLSTAK